MKIERINENQIRCTLTSFDLSARNINLVELAYGTEKARKLFREMIQKASNEVGFEAEDIPLMVEAIPLSSESIMLVITKIEDPEELDTRFAKFSPFTDDNQNSLVSQLASEFLEGAPDSLNYLEPGSVEQVGDESGTGSASEAPAKKNAGSVASSRIFRFNSLDRISEASRAVSGIYDGVNTRIYIASGDFLTRNTECRVEVGVRVEDPVLKEKLDSILRLQLSDNVNAREMQPDGSYQKVKPAPGEPLVNSQMGMYDLLRDDWTARDKAPAPASVAETPKPQPVKAPEKPAAPAKAVPQPVEPEKQPAQPEEAAPAPMPIVVTESRPRRTGLLSRLLEHFLK